jgi:hypothetical protein
MGPARGVRAELERTAEEATYLAVGLGFLALRELRRRLRPAPEPPPATALLSDLADLAGPVARELRSVLDGLGRFARDMQQGRRGA